MLIEFLHLQLMVLLLLWFLTLHLRFNRRITMINVNRVVTMSAYGFAVVMLINAFVA